MKNLLLSAFALFAALAFAAAANASVGFQHLTIPNPDGVPIEVGVWYPSDAPASLQRVETFRDTVALDGAIKGGRLPLILMSHGNGGSYAGHHDTAIALAEAGFVAAALTHPGDNWRDQSRAIRVWERPKALKVLADYMLADWAQHAALDPKRVGAFGFSAGGLTVLAAAGGELDLAKVVTHCQVHPGFYDCLLAKRAGLDIPPDVTWTHDTRIKAVVSAAPALGFAFGRDGLKGVRQPVQLWRAANDQVLPHPFYAEAVRIDLPRPPEGHVVDGAGHYDFLAPCSPDLAQANPLICASANGFDRPAFHAAFNKDVVAFFRRTLGR